MECLVSLMILSLMCLFFSTAIHHVVKVSHQLQSENERMWHIFNPTRVRIEKLQISKIRESSNDIHEPNEPSSCSNCL